jgi:hypothetical protein
VACYESVPHEVASQDHQDKQQDPLHPSEWSRNIEVVVSRPDDGTDEADGEDYVDQG